MTEVHAGSLDHFSERELRCPLTGVVSLDQRFAVELNSLRAVYNRPLRVNSCCRSWAHNVGISGHARSLHVYDGGRFHKELVSGTAAIDVSLPELPADRMDLLKHALSFGWSVGFVSPTSVHLDLRTALLGKPQWWWRYL